jgi:septation ring formation regulator EzrA
MDQNMRDIIDALTFIRDNMATKDDLKNFATKEDVRDIIREELEPIHGRLSNIEAELRDVRERLDLLEEAVGSMKGYAKEIDELRDRVRNIERHLAHTK